MRILFASLLLALPAAVPAQGLYQVGLSSPVTSVTIVRDLRWACAGSTCTAPNTATSPAGNVCASVAKKMGPLTSFAVGAKSFDAAQLEKCNAAAK